MTGESIIQPFFRIEDFRIRLAAELVLCFRLKPTSMTGESIIQPFFTIEDFPIICQKQNASD